MAITARLTLQNDVEQVTRLGAFVDDVCAIAGLDASATMKLNLAVEEAVVNVMNYAYPHGAIGDILLEAQFDGTQLRFVITDGGAPFDPTAREEADTTTDLEERPVGGLGIHLVRQLMDTVSYSRSGDKNVLTLSKKIR